MGDDQNYWYWHSSANTQNSPTFGGKKRYLKNYYHLKNYVQIAVRLLPQVRLGFEVLVYFIVAIYALRSRMNFVSWWRRGDTGTNNFDPDSLNHKKT